jgi:hypothetical protein
MINDKIKELQTLIIQKKDSAKILKKNIKKYCLIFLILFYTVVFVFLEFSYLITSYNFSKFLAIDIIMFSLPMVIFLLMIYFIAYGYRIKKLNKEIENMNVKLYQFTKLDNG